MSLGCDVPTAGAEAMGAVGAGVIAVGGPLIAGGTAVIAVGARLRAGGTALIVAGSRLIAVGMCVDRGGKRDWAWREARCSGWEARLIAAGTRWIAEGTTAPRLARVLARATPRRMSRTTKRPYRRYAARVARSCRSHGGCPWCLGNRMHKHAVRAVDSVRELVLEAVASSSR